MRISNLILLACTFALSAFSGKVSAAELQSKQSAIIRTEYWRPQVAAVTFALLFHSA